MNKRRFFAFGCSYTNWPENPTWADFVGVNYDEYYNFGKPGACNTYIMQKLIEMDEIYTFNPDTDFIMIALTGFGRFTYLKAPQQNGWGSTYDDEVKWHYSWETNGDIMFRNDDHPNTAKLIRDKIFNFAWAAYNSWMAFTIMKNLLKSKNIKHKIIMSIDNEHYINEGYTLGLHHRFDNIGHIVPKIKELYTKLDSSESIGVYRNKNMGEDGLYPNDNNGNHPTKQVYYDYITKHFPELLTDKSLDLLNTPNEVWESKVVCKERGIIQSNN
jgi:hypothetical protein